jgi:hypothetical protein
MDPLRASGRGNRLAAGVPSSAATGQPCPRCQEPLWGIAEGRWCSACGYRQTGSAGWGVRPDAAAPSGAPRRKAGEWSQVPRLVPRWAWVMLGGVAVLGLMSVNAGLLLPPGSWQRAVWTTTQVTVGLVGLLLAQVAVCSWLGDQRDGPPTLWDLLMPDRVWRVAIGRLPETRWAVCGAAWCVTLIVCALVFVGGLTYWLPKKGETRATVHVAQLLDVKKEQTEPEQAPAEAPAPPRPAPAPRPEERPPDPKAETARCVVVGYTVENDEVTSLVVARQEGGELRYAGTVRPRLTAEQRDELLKRFGRLASSRPVFRDFEKPVVWLKPELACEVEHAGAADGPLLKEPRFKGLVEEKKPATAPEKKPQRGAPRISGN